MTRPGPRIDRDEAVAGAAPQTFWGVIEERAARTPDGLCMVDEHGRRVTFAAYRDRCARTAAGLHGLGVGAGTVVAWQLPTSIETIVLCGALSRVGAVQVPLLPIYRRREITHVVERTEPAVLVVAEEWRGRPLASEALDVVGERPVEVVVLGDDLPEADPATLPDPEPLPTAPRWVYFTSGTTGPPKGARHSDDSLLWAAHAEVDCLDTGPEDRTTIVFPFAHVGGSFFFMAGLLAGHGQILVSHFDEDAVEALRREGVTYAGAGLSFQRAYLEAQRARPDDRLFPAIRGFPHGGDAKRPYVHEALAEEIGGVGILSGYGMTEFAMIASGSVHDPPEKLRDRLGRPCAGIEVRIVGADGEVCPPGVEGELRAKGRSMCHGYLDPGDDESGFDDEGYFRTGDVGFLDEDGYLELTGRLKDVIMRKGESISAVEVEDLLHGHPAIREAAVVGIPDEERGELVCAVLVPEPDRTPLRLEEVSAFLLDRGLMTQKCPERLELRTQLPRDFFAKVNKSQLREEITARPRHETAEQA